MTQVPLHAIAELVLAFYENKLKIVYEMVNKSKPCPFPNIFSHMTYCQIAQQLQYIPKLAVM